MCAILDANAKGTVMADVPTADARAFRRWISSGKCCLVIGGRLRKELGSDFSEKIDMRHPHLDDWLRTVKLAGMLVQADDQAIDKTEADLIANKRCRSNDAHIIALAIVSGARLLYSRDQVLHQDFRDKTLIDNPRGKIYPSFNDESDALAWLRRNRALCAPR